MTNAHRNGNASIISDPTSSQSPPVRTPFTDEQVITLALARCASATGSAASRHQIVRLYECVLSTNPYYAERLLHIAAEGPSSHAHHTLIQS